jgi:hypothetical protein
VSKRTSLTLTPADFKAGRRNKGGDCLVALALDRQFGGKWVVGPGSATQSGTGRTVRLGWDARKAVIGFDVVRGGAARRRPVKVTVYEGRRSGKATAVKGGAGAGVALMAVSGSLWWIPLVLMSVIAIPVFIALVMNKVSVPRVTSAPAPKPASPARWPHISGGDPFARTRGTGG